MDISPKHEILSSFTHPQVVPNLYDFFSVLKNKGNQTVDGTPIDIHLKSIIMATINFLVILTFFKISSFVFSR